MQNIEWSKKEASKISIMRMPGVEPGSQAWEACMMPLHYMRLQGCGHLEPAACTQAATCKR